MKRLGIIIRNAFLGVLTVGLLGALVAADWYVRYDPSRKARRLLKAQETPLTTASAVGAAAGGDLFNLEQLGLAEVDLGARDQDSGFTPLLASIRSDQRQAIDLLLDNEAVLKSIDLSSSEDATENPLSLALQRGDFGLAQRLISLGANIDVRFDPERPLLVQALEEERWTLFDFLLGNGADPEATSPDGVTALALALDRQDGEHLRLLLDADASVNVLGVSGEPLLMETLAASNHDLATVLLEAGADPDHTGASGQTPLLVATKAGSTAMVKLLLDYGADPNLARGKQPLPLEVATAAQDVDLMQVLIGAGADAMPTKLMKTAFRNRDLPAMTLLLRSGADPEVEMGQGKTMLDLALSEEMENIALILLESGATARGRLWSALETDNLSLVEMVLRFGAGVGEAHPAHGKPLEYALDRANGEVVSLLLSNGANPNVARQDGESWVAAAIREGNETVVNALIDHGACVEDLVASDGHSLLGWAIAHGMNDVARYLIDHGADVRAREPAPASDEFVAAFERSKTFRWHLTADSKINPLHLAAAQGNLEIAKALMEAGAKKGDYSRRYLWPVNIAAWHMDVDMMQVILGRDPDPDRQPRKVIVDLSSQRATLYENGKVTYSTRISTGKKGYRTPTGKYVITDKHRHHNSSIYGSSMPYFQRFSCAAFGFHEGHVPNYPASHGCIRMPRSAAKHMFYKTEVGDRVDIVN